MIDDAGGADRRDRKENVVNGRHLRRRNAQHERLRVRRVVASVRTWLASKWAMARLRWRSCQTVQTAMTAPQAHGTGENRSENSPVTYKMMNCGCGGGGCGVRFTASASACFQCSEHASATAKVASHNHKQQPQPKTQSRRAGVRARRRAREPPNGSRARGVTAVGNGRS